MSRKPVFTAATGTHICPMLKHRGSGLIPRFSPWNENDEMRGHSHQAVPLRPLHPLCWNPAELFSAPLWTAICV